MGWPLRNKSFHKKRESHSSVNHKFIIDPGKLCILSLKNKPLRSKVIDMVGIRTVALVGYCLLILNILLKIVCFIPSIVASILKDLTARTSLKRMIRALTGAQRGVKLPSNVKFKVDKLIVWTVVLAMVFIVSFKTLLTLPIYYIEIYCA